MAEEAEELTVLTEGVAAPATTCGEGADGTEGFPDDVKETEFVFVVPDKLLLLDRLPVAACSIEFM